MQTHGLNGRFRLDLNMELPQGQTGSVGTTVASAEQVSLQKPLQRIKTWLVIFHTNDHLLWFLSKRMSCLKDSPNSEISFKCGRQAHQCGVLRHVDTT